MERYLPYECTMRILSGSQRCGVFIQTPCTAGHDHLLFTRKDLLQNNTIGSPLTCLKLILALNFAKNF